MITGSLSFPFPFSSQLFTCLFLLHLPYYLRAWNRLFIRELKQQRQRWLRKRHLKSEVVLLQNLSRLFHLIQFVKSWQCFLWLNSARLYPSSGKGKESHCLVFTSSIFMSWSCRSVQKSVMPIQICCFTNLNLLVFCHSR